jgi:ABC-type uncharacterized transport system substrate-binding protein
MRRRQFILGLGSTAWPVVARTQQGDRIRRKNDPLWTPRIPAFTQALANLGWTDGRNVRMDLRWGRGESNRILALAQELVGLQPDVILATATPPTVALRRETRTIPIVFAGVGDPVGTSIVERLDRPSGNVTGFANFELTLAGKWVALLTEIAPGLKRAAIMFNPDTLPGSLYVPPFETAQQGECMRRIGGDEDDHVLKTWVSAFKQAFAGLGWTDGRNVRVDLRWGGNDNNRMRALLQELVGLQPDSIVTGGTPATVALQQEARTIPIVFVGVTDPVASSIVARLNRPGGNITGFANLEASLGGKWLAGDPRRAEGLALARTRQLAKHRGLPAHRSDRPQLLAANSA